MMVPSSWKPLFLVIAVMGDGKFEGFFPMGRERKGEATKIVKHAASAIMYRLIFILKADPEGISDFIRVRFSTEQVKVAMEHSSYNTETGIVILLQTAYFDNNNNDVKYIKGEDWVDLLVLDAKPKLDLGNMDSGIIFDHDINRASISSLTTRVYTNNNMAGGIFQNGSTVVSGFAATTKFSIAPTNDADGSSPPETNKSNGDPSTEDTAAALSSNSAGTDQQRLPPPAGGASVMGAGTQ